MSFVWIAAISLLNIPFNSYGMPEKWQCSEAVRQFQAGQKCKVHREKFVPILLEHNEQLNKQYARDKIWGIAGGVATFIGGMALFHMLCTHQNHMPDYAPSTPFLIGVFAPLWTLMILQAEQYAVKAHHNLSDSKIYRATLEKKGKTESDWANVKKLGRKYLRTCGINKTYINNKNTLQKSDKIELYNKTTKTIVDWNLQDDTFFKTVLTGKYNNPAWELRKKQTTY